MSLSWRKRQALASDQKTWRGLGLDSALWNSIDRNASNVNASLVRTTSATSKPTGIVTGLKFVKTEGLDFGTPGEVKFYASDPSNSSVASQSGVNLFDTVHPSANSGNGLVFTMKKYDTNSDFKDAELGTDISGIKYYIDSGGSGYSVGDDIILQGNNRQGVTFAFSSTSLTNGVSKYEPVVQDPYRITDISVNLTATPAKGSVVQLFDGDLAAAGTLTGNQAPAAYDFSTAATAGTLVGDSFTAFDFSTAATAGTLTGASFAANDFSTTAEDLIIVVDGGTPTTISISVNATNAAAVVADTTTTSAFTAAGATLTDSGSNLVITSNTTGASSTIAITAAGSGTNALKLFDTDTTNLSNLTIVNGIATTNEDLKISVNGGAEITLTLIGNCDTLNNTQTVIDNAISTASVGSVVSIDIASASTMRLLTTTTGAGKTVTMNSSGSGANAVLLFGTPANFTTTTGADATAEDLIIVVDGGSPQTLTINANVTSTFSTAIGALSGITSASVASDGATPDKIKITSGTTGTSSTIAITTTGSGANALALFGTAPFTTTIGNGDANIIASGFLSAIPSGTGNQNIKIHSSTSTTGDFMNSAGVSMKIDGDASNISNNGADIGSVNIVDGDKELKSIEPQKIGFANEDKAIPSSSVELGQYVQRAATLQFRDGVSASPDTRAFSPLKSSLSGNTIITAANMGSATIGAASGYINLDTNSDPKTASSILNGRLTARVTSITNTEPEKGRN